MPVSLPSWRLFAEAFTKPFVCAIRFIKYLFRALRGAGFERCAGFALGDQQPRRFVFPKLDLGFQAVNVPNEGGPRISIEQDTDQLVAAP